MQPRVGMLALALATACTASSGFGVAPGAAGDKSAVTLTAAELDQLVVESWQRAGVTPSPPADDREFLRRVTLDLAGRTPTLGEAKVFQLDQRPDKRAALVDRLLASPEFGEHWADLYANLLWHDEAKRGNMKQDDPRSWFVSAFNQNVGYDKLTGVVLAGRGDVHEHGGLAFIANRLRAGGPEGLTAQVARVFLGVQMQCAQCHDHPYDPRWKQRDFWGMVGYFAGVRVREDQSQSPMMPGRTLVVFDGSGVARMPSKDYSAGVAVEPRFLGYRPAERSTDTLRRTFLRAVLDSDLFPKTMVARTWAQLFGHGLVEPWDDLGGENDPRHPVLLVKLAQDFRAGGFDVKRLVRQIVLSTAYARGGGPPADGSVDGPEKAEAAVRAFARAGIRSVTPEQMFRSLLVMTGAATRVRHRHKNEDQAQKQLVAALREYRFTFDDDEMAEATSFDGSVPQALLLFNGELTNDGTRVGDEGVLNAIMRARPDPQGRLDDMMLVAYGRNATADERASLAADLPLGESPEVRRAYENLFFALITSTEALTNH
jgi:hypothetical protein